MPLYSRAEAVDACAADLRVLGVGLDVSGYGDAADELESAIAHLESAAQIMRAPEED